MRMEEFLPPFMVGWAINAFKFKLEDPLNERHAQLGFDLSAVADETKRIIIMPDNDVDLGNLGGGGSHTQLTDLPWVGSGHTGTDDQLAGFGSFDAAAVITVGAGLEVVNATLQTTAADHAQLTNLPWVDSKHTGTLNTLAGFDAATQAQDVTVGLGLDLALGVLTAVGVGGGGYWAPEFRERTGGVFQDNWRIDFNTGIDVGAGHTTWDVVERYTVINTTGTYEFDYTIEIGADFAVQPTVTCGVTLRKNDPDENLFSGVQLRRDNFQASSDIGVKTQTVGVSFIGDFVAGDHVSVFLQSGTIDALSEGYLRVRRLA